MNVKLERNCAKTMRAVQMKSTIFLVIVLLDGMDNTVTKVSVLAVFVVLTGYANNFILGVLLENHTCFGSTFIHLYPS